MSVIKEIVYFDLETMPIAARVKDYIERFDPYEPPKHPGDFDPDSVKLGNLADPNKITAKIEAAREKHQREAEEWDDNIASENAAHTAKHFDKAALHPSTAQILTFQYAIEDGPVEVIEGSEEVVLRQAQNLVAEHRHAEWINWTGCSDRSNFDLMMLHRRGWALGLESRLHVAVNLTERFLHHADWRSYCSLEKAAWELGIDYKKSEVTGATFWEFYTSGDEEKRAQALEYAREDVRLLRAIHNKMESAV